MKFTNTVTEFEPDRVGGIPGRLYVYGTEHWNPSGSVPDPVGAKFEVKNGRCGKNPVGLNGNTGRVTICMRGKKKTTDRVRLASVRSLYSARSISLITRWCSCPLGLHATAGEEKVIYDLPIPTKSPPFSCKYTRSSQNGREIPVGEGGARSVVHFARSVVLI